MPLNQKRIKDLNKMNVAAQRANLGNIINDLPIVEYFDILSDNIVDGMVTITISNKINFIISCIVTSPDGIVRTITSIRGDDNKLYLGSTSIVPNDQLIITYTLWVD